MVNTSRIKENLFLIEPAKIGPAIKKNLWFVFVVTGFFVALGIYLAKADNAQTYSALAKIIRYDKTVGSRDIPYQFQNFNYVTALETIRTRENLNELINSLNLNVKPEQISRDFDISHKRNSNIIEIKYTSSQKELTPIVANKLSEIFIKNFSAIQNAAAIQIHNYYEKEKKEKQKIVLRAKSDIQNFLKINDLLSIENQLNMLYEQLNSIEIKQLNNLEEKSIELKNLQKRYTPSHPKIKVILGEIKQIEKTISEFKLSTSLMKSNDTGESNSLTKHINTIKNKILNLTKLKQSYDELVFELEESQNQLKIVTNRLNDVKVSLDSTNEDFKFFEYAKIPNFPNPKNKKVIVILLTVVGFVLSFLIVVIKEALNPHIKTVFDLKTRFGFNHVIQFPKRNYKKFDRKQMFSYLAQSLIMSKNENPNIISVGTDIKESNSNETISMLLEQLEKQEKKILMIEQVTNKIDANDKCLFSLNNIPSNDNFNPNSLNNSIDKIYWYIDENYTVFIPNEIRVESFFESIKNLGYDYIVIKTINYLETEHLMPQIVKYSDNFIMATTFKKSDRKILHSFSSKIDDSQAYKLNGVINETHKYYIYN